MAFAVISLLSLSTTLSAQDEPTALVDLDPVVVTGTGTYHKANSSPVAVKVVSSKELKDLQVTNLQDALQKLTSNITTQTNGMGTFVNFNGVSDDYILILENGKRVSGDDRWNRLSISNIKSIEVFSGAASALYGSDAIAGVINIITDNTEDHVEATSSTKMLSKGRFNEDVSVNINSGKLSSSTSYSHRQADNWQVNHYQAFQEEGGEVLKLTGRPMSSGYRSENLSQLLDWRISDKFSAYVKGNYYDYLTKRPQSATYFTQKAIKDEETGEKTYEYTEKQAYTYDLHHKSYTYGGGLQWQPSESAQLTLDVYSDNYVSKYSYWQTSKNLSWEETRKRTHYTNETLKGIFQLASWNKLSTGVELVQESLSSQSDNIDFVTTNTYNLFAQDEIQIVKNLEAIAGFRYTYNDDFGSNVTPNAGLFFHAGGFRTRLSYAGGYRTPTLSQLHATDQAKTTARYTLQNTALRPEKNDFWNLNIEYSNHFMSIGVTGFINKIRDMINYRTLSQAEIESDAHLMDLYNEGWTTIRQRDNIDRSTIQGYSANMKFLIPGGVTLGLSYTYTDSKAKSISLDKKTQTYVTTETPVDKSVKHVGQVNAGWDHTWGRYHLNVSLNGTLQSKRYSSTYGYSKGYGQWDLSTRHTFMMDKIILEPGLGVENIFNKRDRAYWNSNYATINPGRSLMLSLTLKFID